MKRLRIIGAALFISIMVLPVLGAQSLKGMSLNGSTGLYSVPSARIAWERSSDFGLDVGYHAVLNDGYATHIPKMAFSLFKWVELSAAFDVQPDEWRGSANGTDMIIGAKVQFPLETTALALGGNFQALNLGEDPGSYKAGQVYVAVTYAGQFFTMPAETTAVVGKTFVDSDYSYREDWDIDFGMGFDLVILPNTLDSLIHWVVDFANFSYGVEAFGAEPLYRGVLNTGLRFDLSSLPPLNKFKFAVDIFLADAFDDDRSFSTGLVFGIPIL